MPERDDARITDQAHDTTDTPQSSDISDFTLMQLLSAFRQAPMETWRAFTDIAQANSRGVARPVRVRVPQLDADDNRPPTFALSDVRDSLLSADVIRLMLYVVAFVLAVRGGSLWATIRADYAMAQGMPYIVGAFFVWIIAEIVGNSHALWRWYQQRNGLDWVQIGARALPLGFIMVGVGRLWQATSAPRENVLEIVTPAMTLLLVGVVLWMLVDGIFALLQTSAVRQALMLPPWLQRALDRRDGQAGDADKLIPDNVLSDVIWAIFRRIWVLSSVVVWFGTSNNNFSTVTFYLWLFSIVAWCYWYTNPHEWVLDGIRRVRAFPWRKHILTIAALALIIAIAGWFRFYQLAAIPREMTDDHVELILDASLIRDGYRPIFLANNGGREPTQMYLTALASYVPGLGIDHFTIKLIAALESLLTVPVLFWMGYELTHGESQRRRILIGLFTAALLAGSYWHLVITRQALRIPLTPLFAALLIIFLARGLHTNRTDEFVKAGLVLGFGLYMYQAVRMLPVVIVVAVAVAIYFKARHWRERLRYLFNLVVVVNISFMIFLPMFHYSLEFPDLFWRRTAGRLLGDDVIQERLDDGTIIMRTATVDERWQAFQDNVPTLMSNVRNVLLMFNRKGDVAAISGVPNEPAMDIFSGALLIVGLGGWLVLAVKRRDIVYWLIPPIIFIMLLPSALSIAFPVENPSHTRTSGAIPFVYLVCALPLALFAERIMDVLRGRVGQGIAVVACGIILAGSYSANAYIYFDQYPDVYAASFDPYSEPGRYLQGFALMNGGYGNAFMIGYPHWWSHRAIGLAGGLEEKWENGITARTDIPSFLLTASQRDNRFRLNPDRDLLFFYSPDDTETGAYLTELFPNGQAREETTYAPNNDYMVYLVPALGDEGFSQFLQEHVYSAQ